MVFQEKIVRVPDTVLLQDLGEECVIYDTEKKTYFGLDDIGAAMWLALTTQPTMEDSVKRLLEMYSVESAQLRADLIRFVKALQDHELLFIEDLDIESS